MMAMMLMFALVKSGLRALGLEILILMTITILNGQSKQMVHFLRSFFEKASYLFTTTNLVERNFAEKKNKQNMKNNSGKDRELSLRFLNLWMGP